ncbi:MAG TPA: hypothetical protein VJ859_08135 [Allosphingosinicella sp.]|nr:hypothetical protein [Allosphingosinicella sp.]
MTRRRDQWLPAADKPLPASTAAWTRQDAGAAYAPAASGNDIIVTVK